MKVATAAFILIGASLLCLLSLPISVHGASTSATYVSVAPTKGPVGSKMIISGQGFPPNTSFVLNWATANSTWVVGLNPAQGDTNVPEVNGVNSVPFQRTIASGHTNASGYFSQTVTVPVDNNGQHVIQAVGTGIDSTKAQAVFVLVPQFTFSPTSGPRGTPITVFATGLGAHLYATEYHVLWDNNYIGYMTGVTTHGNANFTFYATGDTGIHAVTIYTGYPGPAFLNPQQSPPSVTITNYDPPLIPFHGQFTLTSPIAQQQQSGQGLGAATILSILALGTAVTALASTPILALKTRTRKGMAVFPAVLIVATLMLAGIAMFLAYAPAGSAGMAASQGSQKAGIPYIPQVVVLRPVTTIPPSTATSGPRITVTPNVATVGSPVNVTGLGFSAGALVPLMWDTHVGSHVSGFGSSQRSLRNVTTNAAGSFSFMMKVPADLEGIHNILAPHLPPQGNGTLYIERTASISATQGPVGSTVTIRVMGTGWDYQDNIVTVDYDNSFIGYGCGFNENGNITIFLTAYGAPGYHTIDVWPSFYLGPPAGSTIAIFRYPMLTPFDGPEGIPAFHFSYLITPAGASSQ